MIYESIALKIKAQIADRQTDEQTEYVLKFYAARVKTDATLLKSHCKWQELWMCWQLATDWAVLLLECVCVCDFTN